MNLLNKLTLANLKLNKKRTIVTIIGIILSLAMISAVSSMVASFKESIILYEKNVKGNFHYSFFDVPNEDLVYFDNNRNIDNYYLTQNVGYAILEESKNEDKPYAFILGMDENAIKNLSINLIDGRLPENDNEIVISRHLRTNGRVQYNIGETITLNVGIRKANDGYILGQNNPYQKNEEVITESFTKEYKIVGIIERPGYGIESYSAPGYTFVTSVNKYEKENDYNVYVNYNKNGLKNYYKATADILGIDDKLLEKMQLGNITNENDLKESEKVKYQFYSNSTLIKLENNVISDGAMRAVFMAAIVVVIIIIATSVFCIKNSFDISISEKTRQYGMLSSIGATKRQIKKNVFYEAFILGIIGMPIGILSGNFAAFVLIKISNYLLMDAINISLVFETSILAIIASIILGIVTIYFSAIKSASRASKISPMEAIRNSGNIKIKAKKIRTPKIISKLFGIGGEISYKNLKRNKKKYRTTVISIIVCVSVFIALTSFISSVNRVIKLEYGDYKYNISVGIYSKDEVSLKNAKKIVTLDNIKRYSINQVSFLNIDNPLYHKEYIEYYKNNNIEEDDSIYAIITSLGDNEYKNYIKELGLNYDDVKDKAILINNIFVSTYEDGKNKLLEYKMTDYKIGDTITGLNSYTYLSEDDSKNYESKEISLEVGGVTYERPFGLENDNYNFRIIVSDEVISNLIRAENIEINIDSSDADKLQDDIEKVLGSEGSSERYHINNVDKSMQEMKSLYLLVSIFLYGFITVIALIGVTNIFNTITTGMSLRRSEFATLKSVGMTKKEFNRMIRLESLFYGTKALIIGIPIGIILSYIIYSMINNGTVEIKFLVPWTGIIISILAVFVLIFIIMDYSIKKIKNQNIIETIRNENI